MTSESSGRKNWGIPKHLARFSFTCPPSGSLLKVEVFPPDPSATTPFFVAQLRPMRWAPSVPFSTKTAPYVGLDTHLVQPPLPASAEAGEEELAGTDGWLKTLPYLYSPRARLMWVDVRQPSGAEGNASRDAGDVRSWWPTIRPWSIGLWLEDATIVFERPQSIG